MDNNQCVNTDTSMYLPKDLKDSLIEAAQSEGFSIGRGRGSTLATFVRELLLRHQKTNNFRELSLSSFTPAMRSVLNGFSELDSAQQKQLAVVLGGLLVIMRDQKPSADQG